MKVLYSLYLKTTGRILSNRTGSPANKPDGSGDFGVIDGHYDGEERYYNVELGQLWWRGLNPSTLVGNSIQDIPAGAEVIANFENQQIDTDIVTDGVYSFTLADPGEYKFVVRLFPYKDKEFVVNG